MKGRKLKNCSWLSVWGAVALTLGASAVYILIIANAQRLNYFFFPTLFLHFFCICMVLAYILKKRELTMLRAQLGDEKFFEQFPRERRKEERHQKKQQKKWQKAAGIARHD